MQIFHRSADSRRASLAKKVRPGPLSDYLAVPFPEPKTPLADVPLLAIDLETTGLDASKDRMLSVGFVPINGGSIDLSGARHLPIRQSLSVGQSATIHQLTDDQLAAEGLELAEVLSETLKALAGRVLLAHYGRVETTFLAKACQQAFGAEPVFAVIDTMELQARLLGDADGNMPPGVSLRLWDARAQYGLPVYTAHNALTDALACAELYLAQSAEQKLGSTCRDLLAR